MRPAIGAPGRDRGHGLAAGLSRLLKHRELTGPPEQLPQRIPEAGQAVYSFGVTRRGSRYRFSPERESSVEEELDLITSGRTSKGELDSALAG